MRAKIRKIDGIFPVTVTGAVYYDGTSKTISQMIENGEIGGGINTRDPEDGEIFEVEEVDVFGQIIASVSNLELNEGTSKIFTIKLSGAPTKDQVVNLASSDPKITVNPTSLTFNSLNYNTDQEITVTGVGSDSDYTGTVTITSNTVPNVEVNVTVKNVVAPDVYGEIIVDKSSYNGPANTSFDFKVKLDKAPSKDQVVTIEYDAEVVGTNVQSLTFTPSNYNVDQTVTATPKKQGDVIITLKSPNIANKTIGCSFKPVTVYGNIVVNKATVDVVENGTETFTVKLDKAPTTDQVVSLASNDSTVTVSPESLTFTTQNYNQEQTVTITDTTVSEPEVFGEILLQFETAEIKEGGAANRGVTLDKAPTNDQVINIKADQPWITLNKTSMTFTHDNYATEQFVLVGVKANSITEDSVGHITFTSPNVTEKVITVTGKNVEPDRDLQTSVINKDQLEQGSFENGNPIIANTQFRTKGFYGVNESTSYIFKEKNNLINTMVYVFYDEAKKFLSQTDDKSLPMVTPAGCKLVKLRSYVADETIIRDNLDTIEITLRKHVPVTSLAVSEQNIQVNTTVEIVPTFEPADTSEREFTLESSQPTIVEIVEGTKIKGLTTGQSTVTITSTANPEVTSTFNVNVTDGPLELKSITIEAPDQMFPMNPQAYKVTTDPVNYPKDTLQVYGGSSSVVVEGNNFYITDPGTFVLYADLEGASDSKEIPCIIPSADAPTSIDFSDLFKGYDFKVGRQYRVTTVVKPDGADNSIEITSNPTQNVSISGSVITFNKEGSYTLTVKSRVAENVTNSLVVNPTVVALDSIDTQYDYMALARDFKKMPWTFSPADAIGDIQLSATNDGLSVFEETNIRQDHIEFKPKTGQEKEFDLTIYSSKNPELKKVLHIDLRSLANPNTVSYKGSSHTLYDYSTGYCKNYIYGLDGTKVDYDVKNAVNNMTEDYATLIVYYKFYSCNHYQGNVAPVKIQWDGIDNLQIKQSDGSFLPAEKVELTPQTSRATSIPQGIKDVLSVKFYKAEKKLIFTNHSRGFSYQYNLNTDMETIEFDRKTNEIIGNPDQIIAGGFAFYTSILTDEELNDAIVRFLHDLNFDPAIYTPGYDKIITIGNDEENIESYGYLVPCDPRYKYESSAPDVVTVDSLGFIHPKTEGDAVITAKFTDYVTFDKINISVKPSDYTNDPVKIQGAKAIRIGEIMGGVSDE